MNRKRLFFGAVLFLILLLFAGCGETGVPVSGSSGGAVWYVGFGQAEIALPQNTDQPLYIAGYRNGAEIEGVLDLPSAGAVWMGTDAESGILLIGVDCIGLGSDTAAEIRERLADFASDTGCERIFVYATHTHAGADTLGLWGPVAVDGKNAAYMEQVIRAAVSAAEQAYTARKTGSLYFGQTETEGLQEDSRAPYLYDHVLSQLRFVPEDGGSGTRLIFFSAHAEALRGGNRFMSRDWPGVMADTVTAATGDSVLFLPGAIGGLIMTPILAEDGGEADGSEFYIENCRLTGEAIAAAALSIAPGDECRVNAVLAWAETEYAVPLDNTLFLYYKFLGILGNPLRRDSDSETGYSLTTSCAAIRIGDAVTVAMVPGELFPELVLSDEAFRSAEADDTLTDETFPSLSMLARDYEMGTLLISGLCGDETGYILPPEDYLVNPDLPYFTGIRDSSGENHYEETNSAGIRAAQCLAAAMEDVFAALAEEQSLIP